MEKEEHFYQPIHEKLYRLGFKPVHTSDEELEIMLTDLDRWKDRILAYKHKIVLKITWR